ncbi:hypothetical protein PP175_28540 (plasmid) [Aneurinibacillus sp. Ricciae_BoGa-3]|uniref:hypothetical protein n=1 Tax=Aneurinibacillus sp. Ricciae_BoGa-3 TaxID=3022697 RepID=UPI00233FC2A1|nr:hypothetical protein [Aneurinibacillus sp. Ricciae_BoGa-3]WCK57140.1 hypothetical protein PP175_28540 [Aneurinibacillus sp. Ricciae_BoGa-3]
MGIGLCGILTPEGKWHACEFGKHYQLISELNIPRYKEDAYIPFSSRMLSDDLKPFYPDSSAVGINWDKGVTQAQYDWIVAHFDEMDDSQQENFGSLLIKLKEGGEPIIVKEEALWK